MRNPRTKKQRPRRSDGMNPLKTVGKIMSSVNNFCLVLEYAAELFRNDFPVKTHVSDRRGVEN